MTRFQRVAVGNGDQPHTSGFTAVNKAEVNLSQHYSEQDKRGHATCRKALRTDCFCAADCQLDASEPHIVALELFKISCKNIKEQHLKGLGIYLL